MSWQSTTLHTTNPSIELTNTSTDNWSVDFTLALKPGESLASAAVTLVQTDPPTLATIPGFATSTPSVLSNVASFPVTGTVLTEGRTYRMETAGTLNTGKIVVLLTAVVCVA